MPVGEARQRLDDLYRLIPDQRFLFALGEVDRLLKGAERVSLAASLADGVWKIAIGDEIIGTLPRYPTFADGFASVLARAREVLGKQPPAAAVTDSDLQRIQERVNRFWPPDLIGALQELGQRWSGSPDPRVARLAATAYFSLRLQMVNGLEMADPLEGRALALQAIATAQGSDDPGERTLLAWLMGYPAEARALASAIAPENGIRAYVGGDREGLLRSARGGSPGLRYLALTELAGGNREAEWEKWLAEELPEAELSSPSILRAASGFNRFENRTEWASALIQSTLEIVSGQPTARPAPSPPASGGLIANLVDALVTRATAVGSEKRNLLREFESALARRCLASQGLWDRESCESYWRAHFYAGLASLGGHYLDSLASGPAAVQFAEGLQDPPPGPAAQFARWYGDLASLEAGTPASERELDDLEKIPDLGGWAAARLFDAANPIFPWQPFLTSESVHRLSRNLDTRPGHQAMLLPAFRRPLLDMLRVEKTCVNPAFRAGEIARWAAWCALMRGDRVEVLRQVNRKDQPLDLRVNALFTSASLLQPAQVKAEYRKLLSESRYAGSVVYSYLHFLDNFSPDPAEKEGVVREWLARHSSLEGTLEHSIYSGRLAKAISEQGRHQEAWALIEPLVDTWQGGIMIWAALILQSLDRGEEATQLGRAVLARYPHDPTLRADLAYLLWRNGRHSEAAEILNPRQYRVASSSWDLLGAKFRDAMEGKDDTEVLRAIDAVREGNSNIVLDRFLDPTALARPELVFRFNSTLKTMGHEFAKARLAAYQHLRDREGEESASRWLRGQLAKGLQDMVAPFFFERADYAALWDPLEPAPGAAGLSSTTWLLRAAGSLFGPLPESRGQMLSERFSVRQPGDFHHLLGRFLLDLEPAEALDSVAKTALEKSDAAACHGIRALTAGDYEGASEWFQLSVLMGPLNSPLSNFSYVQLGRWYTGNRTLRLQASLAPAAPKADLREKHAI